jgi:predicted transcriptional regulator
MKMENIQENKIQVNLLVRTFLTEIIFKKKTDILMSINAKWVSEIENKRKTYEFRKYKINQKVKRFWFYFTNPLSQLSFVAEISDVISFEKGERVINDGIGNNEFNNGEKISKFAYRINHLYKLKDPISLLKLRNLDVYPPQRYSFLFKHHLLLEKLWSDASFEKVY